MTTTFLIVSNGENTGNIYYSEERINGVSVTACDDGGLDTRGTINDWSVIEDNGAAIWEFLRTSQNGDVMRQNLITDSNTKSFDTQAIIEEEGMGYGDVGSVQSLTVSDDGKLTDGDCAEPADLSSPDAFRAQVRRWKDAISA